MEKNMTALVSCFSRAYHSKNNKFRIFNDYFAYNILGSDYDSIADYMSNGISYFKSDFKGTKEEGLRYIVDNVLLPSVLARSIYTEASLKNSIRFGVRQYLIFASGYDTFAYRNSNILDKVKVFEIDKKEMIEDKKKRLKLANIDYSKVSFISCDLTTDKLVIDNYNQDELSFSSLLGLSYYLDKKEFINLLKHISSMIKSKSTIVFDYPVGDNVRIEELAESSGNIMKTKYSLKEMEKILEECDLLLYENLDSNDINNQYFYDYNTLHKNKILAPSNVNYALVVKK